MDSIASTTKAPVSLGNKFGLRQTTVGVVKSSMEGTIFDIFATVIRVLESNPQLALAQTGSNGANVILSTIEVDGYSELWFSALVVVETVTQSLFSRVQHEGNTSAQHGSFRKDEIPGLVWSVRGHFFFWSVF